MATRVAAVIPARLESRRFSRKVLYPFHGKPLLFYVWDRVRRCKQVDRLLIATDSAEIEREMSALGAEVVRTKAGFKTGTDRIVSISNRIKAEIYINVQADCFGLNARALDSIISAFKRDKQAGYGTIARPVVSDDELFDPNCVKLVTDADSNALWFSRFPIPYLQHPEPGERSRQFRFLKHIGIYLFRSAALKQFGAWPQSSLEKAESLEQLRILANGGRMRVYRSSMKVISIESLHDLEKISRL